MANKRVESGMGKADDITASAYRNFNNSSTCSFEQIFTPIFTEKNKSSSTPTPGFRIPSIESAANNPPAGGADAWPYGNNNAGNCGPTVQELDPYFPNIFGQYNTGYLIENCDYVNVFAQPGEDFNLQKNNKRNEIENVRTVGFRSPMMLSGWGFDMAKLPVPYTSSDPNNFDPELVRDRTLWKSGPLHVPWDEERQVWNAAGPDIIVGILPEGEGITAPSTPTEFTAFNIKCFFFDRENIIVRSGHASGMQISSNRWLQVINRDPSLSVSESHTEDILVIAIRVNYEFLPIYVGCPD